MIWILLALAALAALNAIAIHRARLDREDAESDELVLHHGLRSQSFPLGSTAREMLPRREAIRRKEAREIMQRSGMIA